MKGRRENRARNRCRDPNSLHEQRNRANKRERDRTQALNAAYVQLRQKIPSLPSDKTSKIHTLRVTVEYIQFLRQLIENKNGVLNRMDFAVHEDNQINLQATFNSWRTSQNQRWSVSTSKPPTAQRRALEVTEKRSGKMADAHPSNKFVYSADAYSINCADYSKLDAIRKQNEMAAPQHPLVQPTEKMKPEFFDFAGIATHYVEQLGEPFNPSENNMNSFSYVLSHAMNQSHL
ncbi:Protein twist [Aphelenchoides fujianensis]|nr:Protein twist [Aphelenchoides fujianensis]